MTILTTLHTSGDGYWSERAKAVNITKICVPYIAEDYDFGELCVYFDDSWDVDNDGLIYTDKLFERELKEWLTSQGYDASDVSYSEQGMQGDHYVSLDVEGAFLTSWKAKHEDAAYTD